MISTTVCSYFFALLRHYSNMFNDFIYTNLFYIIFIRLLLGILF